MLGKKVVCRSCESSFRVPEKRKEEQAGKPSKKVSGKSASTARKSSQARRVPQGKSSTKRQRAKVKPKSGGLGSTIWVPLLLCALGGAGYFLYQSVSQSDYTDGGIKRTEFAHNKPSAHDSAQSASVSKATVKYDPESSLKAKKYSLPSKDPFLAKYDGSDVRGIESIAKALKSGREPWRIEANKRIDKFRKASMKLTVIDNSGSTVDGQQVHVRLTKHKYQFGVVIKSPFFKEL
ncbi:MAG: hypothetical protein HQL32_15920, partial [Planctomycetes bacterium]|nr:hypothetical protein [Planctomycetota bacterium]